MTLTLELTPEEEARLRTEAAKLGLDEISYVRRLIAGESSRGQAKMNPAELVAYWETNGLLAGYGDPKKDSTTIAREIREQFSLC